MNLDTALNLALRATGTKTIGGVSTGEDPFVLNLVDALTTGNGLDQAKKSYHVRQTINAGATHNIYLYGVHRDAFGDYVNLSRVKCLIVSLAGKGRDSNAEALYELYVGGHSSRAWETWATTGVAGSRMKVRAGGIELKWAPCMYGFPVIYNSDDVLRIVNAGSAAVSYDIVFLGPSQA